MRPAAAAESRIHGLRSADGQLLLRGQPWRGIGANYFSLFSRSLKDPADTSGEAGLRRLAEAGIPFVRFMGCGFWPVDWDLYFSDKEEWFSRFDRLARAAETCGVGLIPSLFWNLATVPDLMGEPVNSLGNPDSKTIAFIRQYTSEVVERYRDSPAVWGWEMGNEYNLHADLPNAAEHRPPVWPKLKTALSRSAADELSSEDMLCAYAAFASTVRELDPHRILVAGNAVPRSSAWHNSAEKTWTRDTPEQFAEILARDNPDPFDTICVHVYPNAKNEYPAGADSLSALVATLRRNAEAIGKPLFIGEFGAPRTLGGSRERFEEIVAAIEANRVPLSAFWVYDFPAQDNDWNTTFGNDRRYALERIGEANARMKSSAPLEGEAAPGRASLR